MRVCALSGGEVFAGCDESSSPSLPWLLVRRKALLNYDPYSLKSSGCMSKLWETSQCFLATRNLAVQSRVALGLADRLDAPLHQAPGHSSAFVTAAPGIPNED